MKFFIVLMPLVLLISGTFSSSHPRPTRGPSPMNGKITKLIDNLKNVVDCEEKQENHVENKIQRVVVDLKTAAKAISNKINSFIICKREFKKQMLEKMGELELKLSQLNRSVKECLQRLKKANQMRSGKKDHQEQEEQNGDPHVLSCQASGHLNDIFIE